jgi:predicted flap endonuclease-1-like 5' DNA nuclease
MFENLNPLDKTTAWIEIFLLLFGAFLIGYFFARAYYKRKYQNNLIDYEAEIEKLKVLSMEHANSTYSSGIKAVKTRDRKGELAQPLDEELRPEFDLSPKLNIEGSASATEEDKDDLTLISGIGPFIQKKLNGAGIYTYSQISKFSSQDIDDLTEAIKFFPGRIKRDNWVDQAKKLMNK